MYSSVHFLSYFRLCVYSHVIYALTSVLSVQTLGQGKQVLSAEKCSRKDKRICVCKASGPVIGSRISVHGAEESC